MAHFAAEDRGLRQAAAALSHVYVSCGSCRVKTVSKRTWLRTSGPGVQAAISGFMPTMFKPASDCRPGPRVPSRRLLLGVFFARKRFAAILIGLLTPSSGSCPQEHH